jgi:hypothetical protein
MKNLTVWGLLATVGVAGSAFAKPGSGIAAEATFLAGSPATTNNDDSCDISVAPAATLLLPYFEVSDDRTGETTLFTITNVSQYPAIAHVVLWTDYSYPVIDFNIYLTGYDVQSINLYDVIWTGVVAPASGARTRAGTGTDISEGVNFGKFIPAGTTNTWDDVEPGSNINLAACAGLPGSLPEFHIARMQTAFTEGRVSAVPGNPLFAGCNTVGNAHENAVGYATVDVVNFCGTGLPTDGDPYFTTEIRFDNVLIGDYQQVNSGENFAQGNPMVHIRAVPEGTGNTQSVDPEDTNFDRTFYSRYQTPIALGVPNTLDRRQPLPSLFAARWINGGTGQFQSSFKIWREGVNIGTTCATAPQNGQLLVTESVVFDEDENGEGVAGGDIIVSPSVGSDDIVLPETSLTSISDSDVFPQDIIDTTTAGWVYLNLDNGLASLAATEFATQNWVINSMRAEGRFSVDFDAAWLGNGCTPREDITEFSDGGSVDVLPGPAADETPDFIP